RLLGEQLERLATVVGDLVRDQGGGLHRGPTSIARSYALTVSRPQRSQEKWSSAVSRAASPRAPSSSSTFVIASASASGSLGGTSSMPPPSAAISSGPLCPLQPIAGTPQAIASTYATPNASSTLGITIAWQRESALR